MPINLFEDTVPQADGFNSKPNTMVLFRHLNHFNDPRIYILKMDYCL